MIHQERAPWPVSQRINFVEGPYESEILEGVNHWVTDIAPAAVSQLPLAHTDAYSKRGD